MKKLLHTPDGVRDIYYTECGKKYTLENKINDVFHLYGYHSIQTPMFEFFDVFRKEIGTIPSSDLYKFFDKDGNTLVLRPDITPSVARAVSTLFKDDKVETRLCYKGNTFINHSKYQGRLREVTQMGIELIGDDSVEADAEMLVLVIESMKKVDLKEFQITVGNVDYIESLLEEADLDEEAEERVRDLIANRNYYGIEDYLKNIKADANAIETISALKNFVGNEEVLKKAKAHAKNERGKKAIERLEAIFDILKLYGVGEYITFDLSMTSLYGYYTSMIFRGYTYGTGDAVVKGGRYDKLLEKFGKDSPATGFAIVIDELMNALNRQKINIPYQRKNRMIVYEEACLKEAVKTAKELRSQSFNTELMKKKENLTLQDYIEFGKKSLSSNLIYFQASGQIMQIDLLSEDV